MNSVKSNSQVIVKSLTVIIALILQVITLIFLTFYVQAYFTWAYVILEILSFIVIFGLVNDQESYRQFWIVVVLIFPVTGLFLYFMWGRRRPNSLINRRFRKIDAKLKKYRPDRPELIAALKQKNPDKAQIGAFLESEGFGLYGDTTVKYFPLGELALESMIEDMKTASRCIFMEYFIIDDGEVWQRIKEVLIERAKEGIDIRLLIDDFGCMGINTPQFRNELARSGVRMSVFAPIHKEVDRFSFNYRNHQKITIIDGNIGYCGGVNIADEYANIIDRFGHWKDTAVRLEGEGVWGLTSIFLGMWEVAMRYETMTDYHMYMPDSLNMLPPLDDEESGEAKEPSDTVQQAVEKSALPQDEQRKQGYVQIFADGPANNPKNTAEAVYTHVINKARDYVYITTPYLVLDRKMQEDLCRMARSGVDVRIVVPHTPDKWYVYMVNVANYGALLANGVKIYEYTPGFIHSKTVVSDDECAICGTINMDFRSFYLHYECAVFMYDMPAVTDIRDDILATIDRSERIEYEDWKKRPILQRMAQWVLKIFQSVL